MNRSTVNDAGGPRHSLFRATKARGASHGDCDNNCSGRRAGYEAAGGIADQRGQFWAWVTAVAVPVLALAVALPAHYPNHLDTFGHLGLLYADTVLFVVGAVVAFVGLREQSPDPFATRPAGAP